MLVALYQNFIHNFFLRITKSKVEGSDIFVYVLEKGYEEGPSPTVLDVSPNLIAIKKLMKEYL